MLRPRIDYEKPGRFKWITEREISLRQINIIQKIVRSTMKDIKSSGSKHFGIINKKSVSDGTQYYLLNTLDKMICYNDEFENLPAVDQLRAIVDYAKSIVINQNTNPSIIEFFDAIISKNMGTLFSIRQKIAPDEPIFSPLRYFPLDLFPFPIRQMMPMEVPPDKKTPRELCCYTKEQVIMVAKWWFMLITKHGALIPSNDSTLKGMLFMTSLADSVWEIALRHTPYNHRGFEIPIVVTFTDACMEKSLRNAGLAYEIPTLKSLDYSAAIFKSDTNKIEFKRNNRSDTPYSNQPNFWPLLPNDDAIQFRDILSTITTGANNANSTSLYFITKHVLHTILLLAKPAQLSVEDAKKQIAWNQHRFFIKGERGAELLKIKDPAWSNTYFTNK